ncbi:hypothetical protein HMPREF0880_00929 [Yokenella regensburgei ATCC 43003]|nr:hypothetical protein HMPREF0880_00929 [Yokenella regensburgei ATCC 43003]
MRRGIIYYGWRDDKPNYRFVGDEGATTIDVLALTVTLFGAISNLKAAPGVRCVSTLWAIHHFFILRHH